MNFTEIYRLTRAELLRLPVRETAEPADGSPKVIDDEGQAWVFGDDGADLIRMRDDSVGPHGSVLVEPEVALANA